MMISFIIAALFLFSSKAMANSSTLPADELFDAGLYDKAISNYEELLQVPLTEEASIIKKLALCHYHDKNYQQAIHYWSLDNDRSVLENYYLAIAYRMLNRYEDALQLVELLLTNDLTSSNPSRELRLYELALNHFFLKNFKIATLTFEELLKGSHLQLKILSAFYLARIQSHFAFYEKAFQILDEITQLVLEDNPLRYELAYLKGEISFHKQDYQQAAFHFESSLPPTTIYEAPWIYNASYYNAISYLKLGDQSDLSQKDQKFLLMKAERILLDLFSKFPEEKVVLTLSKCYITQGHRLKDEDAFRTANNILSRHDLIKTQEGLAQALFLRAEMAQTYIERNGFYRNLTQEANRETEVYAKGWYLRGLNDFEEGQLLLTAGKLDEASALFHDAYLSLNFAFQLLKDREPAFAGLALQYQALAVICQGENDKYEKAKKCLEVLLSEPTLLAKVENINQIYYLYNLIVAYSGAINDPISTIEKSLNQFDQSQYQDKSLFLLGIFYYHQKEYQKAQDIFLHLAKSISSTIETHHALFWAARSADQLHNEGDAKLYRQQFIDRYPDSSLAPEALFFLHSYHEYLQGDRAAVKHLDLLLKKYPQSSFAIHGWYLVGLDLKRDRKTAEGKWIRKKNLVAAIDAFEKAESLFDQLLKSQDGQLQTEAYRSNQDLAILLPLKYQASIERVQTILAIADSSQGTKRQIYLEYAEEGLENLVRDLDLSNGFINNIKVFSLIKEEANFWLAQAYIKGGKEEAALNTLNKILDQYQLKKITRGYYLSRVWYEKAMIEKRSGKYAEALKSLTLSEDASKGKVLNADQKLELWIEQSLIYQELGDLDQAILTLSKTINDDSISSLRIKAMFLRAEAYEHQGKKEQARRQLESASKKGGEWAKRASEKLKRDYGY